MAYGNSLLVHLLLSLRKLTTGAHVVLVVSLMLVPYVSSTDELPQVPAMMTFVPPPPLPPPTPPPPPPAPAAARQPTPRQTRSATLSPRVERASVLAPSGITSEPIVTGIEGGVEGGVEGGLPGGVPGGIVGGIVGGFANSVPPPAPPPPPAPRVPVRVGGQIQAPALVKRVEPKYPPMALAAKIEGLVILEALVNEDGLVDDVRVLRSGGAGHVFDRAAIAAVRQWQYSPLILNGGREKFVLTVTLSFNL